MNRRFRVVSWLPKRLEELGIPLTVLLRHAGLPMGLLQQQRMLVSTQEFFALWRSIGEVSGDPFIGLKLGSEEPVEFYDPLSIAVLHSRSLRDAVERMSRYKGLTCPEKIEIIQHKNECAVQFNWVYATENEPSALVDVCFARVLSFGQRGTGAGVRPARVEFQRPRAHGSVYEAHFGCTVKFKSKQNRLVFLREDFDRTFVTHDPEFLEMLVPHLDAELAKLQKKPIHEQVKAIVKRLVSKRRPGIGDVATELNMSVRSLQRRLAQEGVSFHQLLEEARHELAQNYLLQSSIELTETAYLLGFEDSNSFFRAFQRWEGVSPSKWREHRMRYQTSRT